MRKRGFVRFNDEQRQRDIESIAEELRADGLEVTDVARIAGQITGTVEEGDLEKLERKLKSLGGRFVPEEDDVTHHLPDPTSRIQGKKS